MGSSEKFCLRWNDFESNISGAFRELREDKDFFDVTLACDDDQLQAHKVILSACSPFFRTILRRNKHEHPLLYLKGVKYVDLVYVLNFMYHGEVNVAQEELNSFLSVAEDLKVKGLTQNNSDTKQQNILSGPTNPRARDPPKISASPPPPSRTLHTATPAPRAAPANNYTNVEDDDVQEVVPIKSEPVPLQQITHTTVTPRVQVNQPYPAPEDQMTGGVVADPNMEDYSEQYGDYEGFEGDDGAYNTSGLAGSGQEGNKELDLLISNALTRDQTTGEWMCKYCPKTHRNKARISRHAETHFPGFTQKCPYCEKVLASRNSLRTHVSDAHTKGQTRTCVEGSLPQGGSIYY